DPGRARGRGSLPVQTDIVYSSRREHTADNTGSRKRKYTQCAERQCLSAPEYRHPHLLESPCLYRFSKLMILLSSMAISWQSREYRSTLKKERFSACWDRMAPEKRQPSP